MSSLNELCLFLFIVGAARNTAKLCLEVESEVRKKFVKSRFRHFARLLSGDVLSMFLEYIAEKGLDINVLFEGEKMEEALHQRVDRFLHKNQIRSKTSSNQSTVSPKEQEKIAVLVTSEKIQDEFNPEIVQMDDENKTAKLAVIHRIPTLSVGSKQKAWCGKDVTRWFCQTFLYTVPHESVICNLDNAPGHNDVTIDAQITASGRIVHRTPPYLCIFRQTILI